MEHGTNAETPVDDETRIAYIALASYAPTAWQFDTVTTEGPVAKLGEFPPNIARIRRKAATDLLTTAGQHGIRTIVPGDEEWPRQIEDLNRGGGVIGAPLCLWVRGTGRLSEVLSRSILLTGTAAATEYGKHIAQSISYDLADGRHRWTVANAGRFGIDTAAINGASVAIDRAPRLVLVPQGLNRAHRSNRREFFDAVAAEGLLVSAFPPDCEPSRTTGLRSMEFLAALTSATVVVEAQIRSNCLPAARRAASLGRPTMATPGPVTSALSTGCHQLLSEGTARLVTSGPDITDELSSHN